MNLKVSQFYERQWIKRHTYCKDGQFKERYAGKVKLFIKMVSVQELEMKSALTQNSLWLHRTAQPGGMEGGDEAQGTVHEATC